jgi:superfamily II DNA or RNA helicase
MGKLKFNISASSLSLYQESQLHFYYQYIIKAQPDTNVVTIYGTAGNIVHTMLENFIKDEVWDEEMQTKQIWDKANLNELPGLTGKPLSFDSYSNSVKLGVMKLKNIYIGPKKAEEKFLFPLINNNDAEINLKGFIDLQHINDNGDIELIDWKTSSAVKDGEFDTQAKMYHLLHYKKYGKLPTRIIYEYLKIGKKKEYTFTLSEILEFEKYINTTVNEIINKNLDINKYELGDWDTPFNVHRIKCEREKFKRENAEIIHITIKNNNLYIKEQLNENMKKYLDRKYSYLVDGFQFSPQFKNRQWDGKKTLFKRNILSIGFINNFKTFIEDYNEHYKTNYKLDIIDERNKEVMNKQYNTIFKESKRSLREYQKDAINKIIDKKIGIIYFGTGLGKTFTIFELIKKLNKRTLFVVNRIELVEQVHLDMEDTFGIECGKMSEGNLDITKQITVASIQTIYAILKRNDETSKLLSSFLYNINVAVWDEAQNLGDSSYYSILKNKILNAEYIIGLTGSPMRNGSDTLEMNAMVGFPIVEYTTKWGEDNGWLVPTKCYFIKMPKKNVITDTYHNNYKNEITFNLERNKIIAEITEKFKGKKILILTKIIEHGEILNSMIEGSFLINSKIDIKSRKQQMEDFKSDKGGVMIAGIKIAGAGLDIKNLDCVINVSAHKSIVDSIQLVGRVKRTCIGKKYGYLIDFYDFGNFQKASIERINALRKFKNNIDIVNNLSDVVIYE